MYRSTVCHYLTEMPEEKIDEIISEMQELLDDLKGE